jgi:tRNA A37 threonylcarbamoyladenosine synthetase subunit TsaC/SUA5/YrdC
VNIAPPKGRVDGDVQMKDMGDPKNNSNAAGNEADLESGLIAKDAEKQRLLPGPLTVMEPQQRSDPVAQLRMRQKRLERVAIDRVPEIHFLGQLVSARGIIQDSTEGCTIRSIFATSYAES